MALMKHSWFVSPWELWCVDRYFSRNSECEISLPMSSSVPHFFTNPCISPKTQLYIQPPHSKECSLLSDTSASVMQAGLASTAKWTEMNVFLTHARMEELVTIWWMDTGVLARRALKVKTKVLISVSLYAFFLLHILWLLSFPFFVPIHSYSKHNLRI